MRFVLSLVGGVIAGAVLVGVASYALVLPLLRSTGDDEGLLRLERDATSWARIAGGPRGACQQLWSFGDGVVMTGDDARPGEWTLASARWTPSTRARPAPAIAGNAARWFMLEDGQAFSLAEGACQLFAEPRHEALPSFATCPGVESPLEAVTRLDDDSTLALIVDATVHQHRAWLLPAGATAWKDLGVLDAGRAAGVLLPGPGAQALFVSGSGALLALERGQWRKLPTERSPRSGQRAAFLSDGSVVACGGTRELAAQRPLLNFGLPLGALAVFIVAAFYAKARPLPLLLGALGGASAATAVALVILFKSAWH